VSPTSEQSLDKLTLLISHDRSGSHYLRSFIRTLPAQEMIDEICNEQAVDPVKDPMSFFGFRHRLSLDEPDYGLRRNPKIVTSLLDRYFAFVLKSCEPRAVTIDVKYGHIHNFDIAWWPIFRRPFLFEFCRQRNVKIIHLSRWNSLHVVVSGEVAESRKIWHAIGKIPPAQAADAIHLDAHKVLRQVQSLNQQKNIITRWVRGLNSLSVAYEELTDPVGGRESRARVAAFLGTVPHATFRSPYHKVTPRPEVMVRNWGDIVALCRENEMTQYVLPSPERPPSEPKADGAAQA
jgi:hypothetical protein